MNLRFVFALALYTTGATAAAPQTDMSVDPVTLVNTFIGSKDEGNTYPGASAPFGLIQVSPIGSHYAGYQYTDEKIRGFGHSFISGAGCWEQGGQLSILPVTGTIGSGAFTKAEDFDHKKYAAKYTHNGEAGNAGYYKVRLTDDGGIDAETTALTRAAAERYTFSADTKDGLILVNTGQANEKHGVIGSALQIIGDRAVEGRITTHSFCGGQAYTTWFRLEFDRPFRAFGTFDQDGPHKGARSAMQGDLKPAGAWFAFDLKKDHSVTIASAISHVDADGARGNLRADAMRNGKPLAFDEMKRAAQELWRDEMRRVGVDGGNGDDRVVFYSALYRTLLQPLTGSDADGRYRGYDEQIHRADGFTYYEYFSLWDVYRAQNQFVALLHPERARDIALSLLKVHEQNGWLPRWGYANFDTNVMTGDPVTPYLVDLWRYGALLGHEAEAYKALRENAFGVPPPLVRSEGRAGNPNYLTHGFVEYDRTKPTKSMDVDQHHGGSATFEYAQGDCALSVMAKALGHDDDVQLLRTRGGNWKNLWDAKTADKETGMRGFPRPKLAGGEWYSGPDGSYSPRSQHGFHEGTAWQYQWLVQQDVPGLVAAMGGKDSALRRLDAFFAYGELVKDPQHAARKNWVVGPYDYYGQFRYNPDNEPDIHAPWMYVLIGEPWKTDTVLRAAQALFTNAPDGVTGNDDLGTMSAWYLFSAIGLYPVIPGSGDFAINTPRFAKVSIALENGKTLTIDASGARSDKVSYIAAAKLDDAVLDKAWVTWEDIHNGARLQFDLSDTPSTWGTGATPPAPCGSH
jgi:predicted alpha-1,2-mannosidase